MHCALNSGCLPAVCIATVGDLVHRTYFTTCPVCEDRGGRAGEGKETQHSFEELGLLDGNNHSGRKTRLKITADLVRHRGSLRFFHHRLFYAHIRTHRADMDSQRWMLPFAVKGRFYFHSAVPCNYFTTWNYSSSTCKPLLISPQAATCSSDKWSPCRSALNLYSTGCIKKSVCMTYVFLYVFFF